MTGCGGVGMGVGGVRACVFQCVRMSVSARESMRARMHAFVFMSVRACLCLCVGVSVCVCVCVCVCVRACVSA